MGALLLTLAAATQEPPAAGLDRDVRQATERALRWLAGRQNRDGSFGAGPVPVATASLAGLAFLSAGHTPDPGPYSPAIAGVVRYLLRQQEPSTGYLTERGVSASRMHGHGFATLFLTQVYGLHALDDPDEEARIAEAIRRAVRLIERAQDRTGGWGYVPDQRGHEGSVTITQVMPLWAARNAGFQVSTDTIDMAIRYIRESTNDDGTVNYQLNQRRTSFALTAAGMSVVVALGQSGDERLALGLAYLDEHAEEQFGQGGREFQWTLYGSLYATLALVHAGGDPWTRWYGRMRAYLLSNQDTAGSWTLVEGAQYGAELSTAMAVIALNVPARYLPILQRYGD